MSFRNHLGLVSMPSACRLGGDAPEEWIRVEKVLTAAVRASEVCLRLPASGARIDEAAECHVADNMAVLVPAMVAPPRQNWRFSPA